MTIGRIPSVEGGIQPTIVDAKGDLIAGVAADSINRLAVGSNDQVLVADSTQSTGLAWKSYGAQFVAGKNKIINGDFGVWQRGTSKTVTADDYYAPDRFLSTYISGGATVTWSQQTFTPGTAPVTGYEGTFFSRLSATSGSGTTVMGLSQKVEDVRTLANQTATFSFWAKADSARLATILIFQEFGSGGSATVIALNTTQTLSTSWTRYSFTVAMPSVSGKTIGAGSDVRCYVYYNTGAASGSPQLDTWGWQLEAGSTATPFTTATGTIQGELAACQRYYFRYNASNVYTRLAWGSWGTTTSFQPHIKFPVTMRIPPSSVEYSTLTTYDTVTFYAVSAVALDSTGTDATNLIVTTAASTQYRFGYLLSNNSTAGYIGFNSEL